jgi:RNA polymerase-associated protein CTR9
MYAVLGIQLLATRNMDEAMRSFEGVLAVKATNLVALLGKAWLMVFSSFYH